MHDKHQVLKNALNFLNNLYHLDHKAFIGLIYEVQYPSHKACYRNPNKQGISRAFRVQTILLATTSIETIDKYLTGFLSPRGILFDNKNMPISQQNNILIIFMSFSDIFSLHLHDIF